MNKKLKPEDTYASLLTKLLRIMRLMILMFILGINSLLAASGYSQSTKITLKMSDTRIEDVLNQIESKSEFFFLFNQKQIDVNRKVSIEAKNEKISDILDELFAGTDVKHQVIDRQIVLTTTSITENQQQVKKVTGKVTDSNGGSLPGVSIVVKGTTTGVITDNSGNYTLSNIPENATLQFSFVGMKMQEILVGSKATINVTLAEDAIGLEEVVAIGYGTVRKSDLAGSVSQVKAKDLMKIPSANISQALQGNVAGLWSNQSDRSPGAGVYLSLRGSNSFSGNSPLFIVDGFPIASGGGVEAISPSDIESVSVLKDASSIAIYGARAANGVILITTKAGKLGKSNLEVGVYHGFQSFVNPVKMLNGAELADLRRDAYKNSNVNGGVAVFRSEELEMLSNNQSTNWWDEITGSSRDIGSYQISFTGGTENTRIMVSGNLYNEKGIVNNSGFTRGGIRTNIIQKIKKFTLTSNSNISLMSGSGVTGESILYPASIGNPLAPVRQKNGDYYTMIVGVGNTPWANPVAYNRMIKSSYLEPHITSTLALEYLVFPGLKIKSQLSGEADIWKQNYYVPIKLSSNHVESGRVSDGYAQVSQNVNYNWMSENTISFNKLITNKDQIEALAGFSTQNNRWESLQASASGFTTDLFESYNMGNSTGEARKPASNLQEWSLMSYFGRMVYTRDNKYIITGNFRSDGSSRFGANNKWGFFPSAAIAWKMTEEPFIKSLNFFNDLKLRSSYGLAGNAEAIGVYMTQARLGSSSYNWNGTEAAGYYTSQLSYENLKWETTKQFNAGLDFSILDRRLNVTVEYYIKNTKDLIRSIPILDVSGFQNGYANLGNLENKGLEITLNSVVIDKGVKWNTTLNLAGNKNKLTSLGNGTTQIGTTHWVGQPIGIGARYMIEKIGIWQTTEVAEAAKYGSVPGNVKYRDLNNDQKIDNKDRAFQGNLTPDYYGSLTNNVTYRGFDLNVFATFEQGRDVYNGLNYKLLAGDGYDNHRREILERWTTTNPTNKYPRAALGGSNRSSMTSTEFLEDASFIKLKSVSLGYTLAHPIAQKIGLDNIRFYFTGTNLLTFTKFTGMDPEDGDYSNNARNSPYPIMRILSIGFNAKF